MPQRAIACRDLVELITDYLEDALPRRIRRGVERHLEACAGCRTALAQMRETIRMTGKLSDEQIPQDYRDRLLLAFRDWTTGSP